MKRFSRKHVHGKTNLSNKYIQKTSVKRNSTLKIDSQMKKKQLNLSYNIPKKKYNISKDIGINNASINAIQILRSKFGRRRNILNVYQFFDKDQKGFISKQNLGEIFPQFGLMMNQKEIEETIQIITHSKSKNINLSDFIRCINQQNKDTSSETCSSFFTKAIKFRQSSGQNAHLKNIQLNKQTDANQNQNEKILLNQIQSFNINRIQRKSLGKQYNKQIENNNKVPYDNNKSTWFQQMKTLQSASKKTSKQQLMEELKSNKAHQKLRYENRIQRMRQNNQNAQRLVNEKENQNSKLNFKRVQSAFAYHLR